LEPPFDLPAVAFLLMPQDMSEWAKRAFDQVNEITRQVLSLSAGITTVSASIVFATGAHVPGGAKRTIALGWGFFVLSVVFCILTLMSSAGIQQKAAESNVLPNIYASPNIRVFGAAQLIAFLGGVVLSTVGAAMAVGVL
jgi:hypothetical protein